MISFDTIDRSLTLQLDSAPATELQVLASFAELDSPTQELEAYRTEVTETDGTSEITVVPAPIADKARILKYAIVQNTDNSPVTVTVNFVDDTLVVPIVTALLSPSDSLQYLDGSGWTVITLS